MVNIHYGNVKQFLCIYTVYTYTYNTQLYIKY